MTNGIRYKTIDHTADIAIKAYGKTLAEAFGNAAFGMFDIIADISQFKPVGEFRVELEAPDLEQMLV
ncbi:MAG: archease, partial [Thermoplasmata archaeon]|nr:archease [Thermoplasmata archaeon]